MLRPLAFRYFDLIIEGKENLPPAGGYILAANHASALDPILIALVLDRPIHFLAKYELFQYPILRWVLPRIYAIPLRRGRPDRSALRIAIERVRSGKIVGIFPEGTRSSDGQLQALRGGAALIALHAGAPIVPVAVAGSWELWPKGRWFPRRGRVRITFGKPISAVVSTHADREALEALSGGLAHALQTLLAH
ncbi:MAG: 1-acyl-sn-glycerol-3-phosphate acyltransferase [Limnochordales bacterium]|nr:1-acyl-sn-glycerol-3-phosphate acyltransferase [Limnochordales bacterium]